jgi:hypothetical protein
LLFLTTAFSKTNVVVLPTKPPKLDANQILIPIGKNGEKISLVDLSFIRTKEYETLTGKKMTLANKLEFKLIQKNYKESSATMVLLIVKW